MYLSVKTSCTQESLVKDIGAVGSCNHYDSAVGAEAVHLCKQLVECVLALVVTSHRRILATCTAYGINLVNEYDTWCFLFCLTEKVTYARRTYTHEHFHEVGARHREERNVRLACHSLREQGLSCSRRAYKQCSLRDFAAELGVNLRIFEEVYNLFHLLLCAFLSCNIFECYGFGIILVKEFCLRLAHIEYTALSTSAAAHASHDEYPYTKYYKEWSDVP